MLHKSMIAMFAALVVLSPAALAHDAAIVAVDLSPDQRRLLVNEAAGKSGGPSRLFKVCNQSGIGAPIKLDIQTTAAMAQESSTSEQVVVAAGDCVFVRGPMIEAWREGGAAAEADAANKAHDWLTERIAALEADLLTQTDPAERQASRVLLDAFTARKVTGYKALFAPTRVTVEAAPE